MANLINKLSVATGVDSRNNFDLSCFHATTSTFYTPRITYFHEFVPGEKWKMDARCSVQLMPMIKPTIADIKVHNRFFFVPYYAIMNHWNEFLAETPMGMSEGITQPKVPWITEQTIVRAFNAVSNGFTHQTVEGEDYDYTISGDGGYKFTSLGRIAYSVLNGLGYVINFGHVTGGTSGTGYKLSMLPLLAYLKVYLDWYNNSSFDTKLNLNLYFDLLHVTGEYNQNDFSTILKAVCQLYLEKDYFTSSTLYPIGSNSGSLQLDHIMVDISQNQRTNSIFSQSSNSGSHGTPVVISNVTGGTTTGISKYSIDAVNALTDYVKRHQLAGVQPFNRVLAEYGVTLKDEELKRSTFIGDVVEDVDIHQVVNQASADDTVLGDRGAFGSGGNSKKLDFHNNNFGCIICVSTIVPRTSYTDGLRRHVLRTERFDFFTPSVEHLGVEPVLSAELYNRFVGDEPNSFIPAKDNIFGYMPRYAAYKTALDTISGDFVLNTRKAVMNTENWIMKRVFNFSTDSSVLKTISENFTTADPSKVSNIFADNETDNFIIFNMYHVKASLPMHKLFDDYQWSNEEDKPQHVTIANQGVQLT